MAQAPLDDPVARLDKQLANGKIKLDFRSDRLGYPSRFQKPAADYAACLDRQFRDCAQFCATLCAYGPIAFNTVCVCG
jgi:hypothetical protein